MGVLEEIDYDVIIVGAGIAGNALAHALGEQGRRVLLIERDLKEPDRIVGELLQPGGVRKLAELGLQDCLEGIDSCTVYGYAILMSQNAGQQRHQLPYPPMEGKSITGRSFHHGRFVQRLREASRQTVNVTLEEGTVIELLQDEEGIFGVRYKPSTTGTEETIKTVRAALTVVSDGCFSNLRFQMMPSDSKPLICSYFVGLILENCRLPYPNHGHVFLADPGPILSYQIGSNELRVLVDIPTLPSDIVGYLRTHTAPQLPEELQKAFLIALDKGPLKKMPNSRLFTCVDSLRPGLLFLGDAWNMRHPLTGGGMTVALSDCVTLRDSLSSLKDFRDRQAVLRILRSSFLPKRKPLAVTINILANALYDVFSASNDPILPLMRLACLDYFKLGGSAVSEPMSLLGGVCENSRVLLRNFFMVALYGVWKLLWPIPWPSNILKAYRLLGAASWIVIPLMRGERTYSSMANLLALVFWMQKRSH